MLFQDVHLKLISQVILILHRINQNQWIIKAYVVNILEKMFVVILIQIIK